MCAAPEDTSGSFLARVGLVLCIMQVFGALRGEAAPATPARRVKLPRAPFSPDEDDGRADIDELYLEGWDEELGVSAEDYAESQRSDG